ncbi:MAG: response regulator transcription factor [Muribaculaceae bacterium]|nr:response regulator transcription factor [Muribaculaceae bacterium]
MARDEKIHIVIAESSPVLAAGFSQCMRRLPGINVNITEVKNPSDLETCVKADTPDILLVNPTFGGAFNPESIKDSASDIDFKIAAIEIVKLDKQVSALYDGVISVIDDIDTITAKIKALCSTSKDTSEEKENLSQREKEIISLVVKGLTNQEIADKLFLSIHTVITHRRNIARKLEIHSATGLTIYAIVNKIVDLSEIKL